MKCPSCKDVKINKIRDEESYEDKHAAKQLEFVNTQIGPLHVPCGAHSVSYKVCMPMSATFP